MVLHSNLFLVRGTEFVRYLLMTYLYCIFSAWGTRFFLESYALDIDSNLKT